MQLVIEETECPTCGNSADAKQSADDRAPLPCPACRTDSWDASPRLTLLGRITQRLRRRGQIKPEMNIFR